MIYMLTVGLPKGLLYYRYKVIMENFLNKLNVKYVTSENSNFKILEEGKNICIDEACLSLKLFMGHVKSLENKCDVIIIPRIYSLEKGMQVCTNFNCLYDLTRNLFPNLKIIEYNIDVSHNKTEEKAFISLGKKLGFSKKASKNSYYYAKQKEHEYEENMLVKTEKKLKSNKPKILIYGHQYNILDSLIGKVVTKFLLKENIEIIYSYEMKKEHIIYSEEILSKVHWTMNKELLASFMYYKDKIDGVIMISAFPCGPDSLTNEVILRKKKDTKVLLLTFEDLNSDIAVETRIESFIDMIKGEEYV